MKKVIIAIIVLVTIIVAGLVLTGCTLTVETTDNSVSASVDGDTTEKVDGIIDWIKNRLDRLFTTEESGNTESVPEA